MGSIAGPIISFRFNAPSAQQAAKQLSNVVGSTMAQASKSSANQFVSDWQAAAAKLRASLTGEKMGLNQIAAAREKIIALATRDRDIALQKTNLSRQDLALMKSATLEIEKQKNALEGFGAVTSPTRKIVQQMISGIGMRAGSYGGGFGSFAGVRVNEALGKMAEEASGARLALLGVGAAAIAVGAAIAGITKHMLDLAQSIENTSASTGLSTKQVQTYSRLAKEMGIDAGTVEMGFARIQSQLGEYITTGKAAGSGSQYFVKVLNQLGVALKDTQGNLRPVNDIISDFSDKLQAIQDPNTRFALALEATGTRGRFLAQMMNEATIEGKSLGEMLREISNSGVVIPDSQLQSLMQAKRQWDELGRSIEAVKIKIEGFIANQATNPKSGFRLGLGLLLGGAAGEGHLSGLLTGTSTPSSAGTKTASGGTQAAIMAATSQLETLQERLQVLRAGGEQQLQLMQAQASYSAAVKSHNAALADIFKQQINDLKQIISLEGKRPGATGTTAAQFNRMLFFGPQSPLSRQTVPYQSLYPSPAPWQSLFPALFPNYPIPSAANPVTAPSIASGTDKLFDDAGKDVQEMMREITQASVDAATKIRDANLKAAQDMVDAWRQARDEGKQLFETLLSGGKNFTREFTRQLENIALTPVQNAFGTLVGNLLYGLEKIVPGNLGGSGGGKAAGGWLGKIWQGIGKATQPPKSIQQAMETIQNAQITATNVYINGQKIGGLGVPLPKPSSFLGGDGLLGFLSGGSNFSTTASSGGLLGLLAGNNIPANVYSGGLLSLIGGSAASTSTSGTGGGGGINPSSAVINTGSAIGGVGGALLQTIGSAIPGGALLGAGLYERGTSKRSPQAIAMGGGLMAQGVLGTIGKLTGGSSAVTLSSLAKGTGGVSVFNSPYSSGTPQSAGDWLGVFGQMAGGIGQIIAGSQVKGLGGVLQGAMGGAQLGTAILPGIGTGIGAALGGLISGIFGGGSASAHAAAWQKNVTTAMNNQRVTLPQSETYAFASGNSMASIFSNTFAQGPGGTFTKAGLSANTPFWGNAIYGTPRNTQAQIAWNSMMNNLNPNSPFYGGTQNPFTMNPNQLPSGMRGTSGLPAGMYSQNSATAPATPSSGVQVHFNLPGVLDANSASTLLNANSAMISKIANRAVYQQSSGSRKMINRAVNLP